MTARPRGGPDDARLGVAHAEQVAAFAEAERRAVRVVAGRSFGIDDCRELLGMLGLERAAGVPPLGPRRDEPAASDGTGASSVSISEPASEPAPALDLDAEHDAASR